MDRIIDFNEIKSKAEEKDFDKDMDKLESYIYSLYYEMAAGKLTMADFTKEVTSYMEQNNISQDKFLKMQTKLMERYGFDASALENQIKALGLDKFTNFNNIEQARKSISFQEKYKERIELKTINTYYIENDKNDLSVLVDGEYVILRSSKKIDLNDVELNEFLCSYKKVVDNKQLKISICENTREFEY